MTDLTCSDQRRRTLVREAGRTGLDYVEVSPDGRTLTVCFLGKAPDGMTRDHVKITGPAGSRPVELEGEPVVRRYDESDETDCMEVHLVRPGDLSTYTLGLVSLDEHGRSTNSRHPGVDPRFASLPLSFGVVCPSDLDCVTTVPCPEPEPDDLDLDYLAKDYSSFRQVLLDRLSLVMPGWQERHVPDVGIALVELLAYIGDRLSYQQDVVATEAYLGTAQRRISVRRHARLVDYTVHEGCNARTFLSIETEADQTLDLALIQFLASADPRVGAGAIPTELAASPFAQLTFEPVPKGGTVEMRRAHNTIRLYTWDDRECCLPEGATRTTLRDEWAGSPGVRERPRRLHLRPGDIILFEEVKGPRTGDPADADPTHRHPVRLKTVDATQTDPLHDVPVVEVTWDDVDALPFSLCVSALRESDCSMVEDVSVAMGNVLLVDHGRTVQDESLGDVLAGGSPGCCGENRPTDRTNEPLPFVPRPLKLSPLTFRQSLDVSGQPAARQLRQDPRKATPAVLVKQTGAELPAEAELWHPQPDLLSSTPYDRSLVVEVDDDTYARLRFGDGRHGRRPEADTHLSATYRIGNGPAGNVGVGAISRVIRLDSPDGPDDRTLTVRNPLAATGGTAPEPLSQVRALAPVTFGHQIQRAITADDYATLAMREDVSAGRLQRAAASMRWTGSWFEVLTTADPLADSGDDGELLLSTIAAGLAYYRRINHDLVVAPARYVPLLVELTVCVLPGYLMGHVKVALLEVFSNRTLPGGGRGFFHPDRLTFGDDVTVSGLTAAAAAVSGVESVQVTRLERQQEGPRDEVASGLLRLGPDEIARLDNNPSRPGNGALLLKIGGGR